MATEPTSAYHAARIEHDRRFGDMASQIRFFRGLTLFLAAVAGIAVWQNTRLAAQPKAVPYVVEVDRLGQIMAFGALQPASVDQSRITGDLFRFVTSIRRVHMDPVAQMDLANEAYSFLRGQALAFVDAEYSDPVKNPMELGKKMVRRIDVRSIQPVQGSDKSWMIEWTESVIRYPGNSVETSVWRATASVEVIPPEDQTKIRPENPFGVYVTKLSWQQVSAPEARKVEQVRRRLEREAVGRASAEGEAAP